MTGQEAHINEVVTELLEKWVNSRRSKLSKFKDTGKLHDQLDAVARGLVQEALTYGIKFPDSGRFLDMKRKPSKGIGRQQIEDLKKWAERNLATIRPRMEKRYENARKPPTDQRIINDIAWGIARNRTKKGGRRKRWYNRPKGAMIAELYDKVAEAMLDTTAEEVLKGLR